MPGIVKTVDVIGGKARLDGRRVSVFQIGEMYTVAGDTPEEVADQLSVSLADVHTALGYCYDHPDEMAATSDRMEAAIEDLADRPEAPEEAAREIPSLAFPADAHVKPG